MNTIANNLSIVSLAALMLTGGCAETQTARTDETPQPVISDTKYTGPGVSIESRATTHNVIIATPTGGWSVVWDGKFETEKRIHLTVRRPNPEFFHVQQIVEHRIDSTIPSGDPLEVFVRIVDHDDQTDSAPYLSAAHTSG